MELVLNPLPHIWQLTAIGLVTMVGSFVTGFLGAGGGIVAVPLLLYLLPVFAPALPNIHQVSSLAAVQAVTSSVGATAHYAMSGALRIQRLALAGTVLGAASLAGGLLSAVMPGRLLLATFCIVTSIGAISLPLVSLNPTAGATPTKPIVSITTMSTLGLLGGAIGVGIGPLIIAVLLRFHRLPMRDAKSTGVALNFFAFLPGLVGKAVTGQVIWLDAAIVSGITVAAAAAGSSLSATASPQLLRKLLVLLTVVIAARSWIDLVWGR